MARKLICIGGDRVLQAVRRRCKMSDTGIETATRPPESAPVLPSWVALGRILREAQAHRAVYESQRLGDFAFRHGSGAREADSPIYRRVGATGEEAP